MAITKTVTINLPDIHYRVLFVNHRVHIKHQDQGLYGNTLMPFHGHSVHIEPKIHNFFFIMIQLTKMIVFFLIYLISWRCSIRISG